MGERLVIQINRNNKPIATSYYHWSAYTVPAIELLHSMYTNVLIHANNMSDDELQLALIRLAEKTTQFGCINTEEDERRIAEAREQIISQIPDELRALLQHTFFSTGGVSHPDLEYAKKKFDGEMFKTDGVSRNEGLVAITESSMSSQLQWADGIIVVDLDKNTVNNGVVYAYNHESYLAETEFYDDVTPIENLPRIPIDIGSFRLDELEIVKDVFEITMSTWMMYEDTIYQMKQ